MLRPKPGFVKARARETGSVKIIDIVRARLDPKNDCYIAELPSLTLKDVRIEDQLVRDNERMLTDGFYAEVTLTYDGVIAQEKAWAPLQGRRLAPDSKVEIGRPGRLHEGSI
jgi:ATP-dependent Lon protease